MPRHCLGLPRGRPGDRPTVSSALALPGVGSRRRSPADGAIWLLKGAISRMRGAICLLEGALSLPKGAISLLTGALSLLKGPNPAERGSLPDDKGSHFAERTLPLLAGEPGQLKGPPSLLKEASVPAESAPLLPVLVRGGPPMGMAQ